ncbi:MAG: response regulator [Hungatella sp.]
MYRIILVDDEPLILAGIASLITWEDYDCTIIGKATNGPSAYDMITKLKPDIVITDIRMPVLNGLELIEKCKANGCVFSFLVLTNLEEFHLARKALALGASDYLVKLDLSAESLIASLMRAKENCNLKIRQGDALAQSSSADLIRAYLNQLLLMQEPPAPLSAELASEFQPGMIVLFSMRPNNISFSTEEEVFDFKQINAQISDILSGISARFFRASTLLNYNSNTYLLVISPRESSEDPEETIQNFCTKVNIALKTYFELTAVFGISQPRASLIDLTDALQEAITALEYYYYDSAAPIVFYHEQHYHKSQAQGFNINFLKKDLSAAIQTNNSEQLAHIFRQIIDLFQQCQPNKEHATSACINIYTYLYSFFDNEGNNYQEIFPFAINIASHLNHFNSLADILAWLQSFCDKLCKLLLDRRETRSDKLIEMTKRYVAEHYEEKLSLTEIADALNISSGHLSNTFKKFTGSTLSDYIAEIKIDHAKDLIDTHQYLMYEISDKLGFDNPYYFSKVFKKIAGVSPREHENRNIQ